MAASKKIKKIIAREGLIIIFILVVSFSMILGGDRVGSKYYNSSNWDNAEEKVRELFGSTVEEGALDEIRVKFYGYLGATASELIAYITLRDFRNEHQEYKDFRFRDLLPYYNEAYPNSNNFEGLVEHTNTLAKKIDKYKAEKKFFDNMAELGSSLQYWGLLLLLCVYPLLLIVRFILWAIKTLKEKG